MKLECKWCGNILITENEEYDMQNHMLSKHNRQWNSEKLSLLNDQFAEVE